MNAGPNIQQHFERLTLGDGNVVQQGIFHHDQGQTIKTTLTQ